MRVYNQKLQIQTIVERWDKSYGNHYDKWQDKFSILQRLEELDLSKCKAEDIDKIIGNPSWTHFMCMSCESYKSKGITFTDDCVCLDCIKDSLALLNHGVISESSEVGEKNE